MVFSTIESDITKSGQALSIFGKELQNVYHDFNSAIHSIKTKTGDISQFSIGRILGNKLSQQDIDSIRRYNDEIRKYNEMTDDAITPQTAFYKCLGNSSSAAQKLARDANGAAISEETLKTASQTSTVALKAQSIAMNLLGNIAITAIIIGISKIVKGFVDLVNHVEITKKKVEDLKSTFQSALDTANSNAKRVEELADRYDELSDGVNNLGENVSLTNEEYEEYNTLVNEIADMFPNLIQGYTDEGNAILNLKGNVEALRDAYKEAQQEAYNLLIANGQDSDGNDIIQQWKDLKDTGFLASILDFGMADVNKSISVTDAIEQLKAIQNMTAERYKEIKRIAGTGTASEINTLSDIEKDIAYGSYLDKALGLTWDISDEDFINAKKQAKVLVQTYNAEIETALADVKTLANAYLMTNEDYAELDSQSKRIASILTNGFDFDVADNFKSKEDVGAYVDDILTAIKTSESEIQSAFNELLSLDTENLSLSEAKKQVDSSIQKLSSYLDVDENQLKISFGFEFVDENFDELQNILNRAKEKFNLKLNWTDVVESEHGINTKEEIALLAECIDATDSMTKALELYDIRVKEVANTTDIVTESVTDLSSALENFSKKTSAIKSAMEDMADTGYISADTYASLAELGGNFTDCLEVQNGKLKLNVDKLKDLETQEYKNTITANALTIAELEMSKARAIAAGADYSSIQALIDNLKNENALWSTLITEVYNADVDDGNGEGDSTEPESITKFKKALAEKEHLLNTNQISEQDYYEWLDSESKRVYGNLADYEEDLWKYEEQVYKWRQEQEQDLFDKKIENYKKLSDNALDKYVDGNGKELTVNASFDYARSQINSAITDTQNRINELSLKTGFEDEIEELTSDLEDLYDTLDDISKKEIESQKDYINELKDNYSDSMDEIIDKQKELADTIDKAYENQIDAIDKQIDAIEKKNEAEKRQNDILEARKKLEEAKREDAKNAYVSFNGTGFTIHQTTEAQDEAQADLDEAKQDEQIAKLEEQKEILETQRDNSKDYYDKVIEDLESQKEAREKQYDILVGIYEQLGGEKKQASLNESLVSKLTKNGDINKAVQGLTPTELQQAFTSGILTTDSNGNYAIDYSILGKNEEAVNKNTAELEKLNSQLSGETNIDTSKVDMTKPHLDSEGYLVGTNGKRVLHDGKGIKATTKAEWEKKKTPYAGFETMTDLFTAIKSGSFNLPNSWSYANQTMNSNIMNSIGKDIKQVPEYVNNVTNSNAPTINFTVNVEGSADQKTVRAMEEKITAKLVEYTDAVTNTFKRKYSSI